MARPDNVSGDSNVNRAGFTPPVRKAKGKNIPIERLLSDLNPFNFPIFKQDRFERIREQRGEDAASNVAKGVTGGIAKKSAELAKRNNNNTLHPGA